MSLRTRLVLVLGTLAVAGLLAADIATYAALDSFLVGRVDRSATATAKVLADSLRHRGQLGPNDVEQLSLTIPGAYVQARSNGSPISGAFLSAPTTSGETLPAPKLPKSVSTTRFVTVGAVSGSTRYRVRSQPIFQGYTLVVAAPLNETTSTLHRLLLIELLVSLGVVAAVVGLGLWLVRLGLRPLRRIEETAGAIAAGDLSRRIEATDERTEVGRLGSALNAMLGHIERAFSERAASEARLRRFIADASHELRTPLSAVTAYAELFRRGARDRPDDLERAMSGIERESARMAVLVDDLLLLARLDQGRPLERKEVDLTGLVGEAVDTARTVEPNRRLELEAPGTLLVTGDPGRLRQVIDNLLANVRAHTPPSAAARVRVDRENGSAVVEVADDGPGLTEEQAAHVFDRFYRGDPSRSRDAGGSGLGLAIVAAVTEAHGGDVSLSSSNGHGVTIRVRLPLRPAPDPGAAPVKAR
jgi:two-component system OmpR family sensor kinase